MVLGEIFAIPAYHKLVYSFKAQQQECIHICIYILFLLGFQVQHRWKPKEEWKVPFYSIGDYSVVILGILCRIPL